METHLLSKPELFPSKEILIQVLGNIYDVFEELEKKLTQDELALTLDWNYYNDGKSWLCKVVHKKKTVFWLSIWDGFIQAGFFFLVRHLEGIAELQLEENSFTVEKEIGKLIPFVFRINKKEQIENLLKMVEFKKKAK